MRSTSRICDVSINTVSKLLVDAERFCDGFHDAEVRGVTAKRVQCDEIWSFTYAKQKNVAEARAAPGGRAIPGLGRRWTANRS